MSEQKTLADRILDGGEAKSLLEYEIEELIGHSVDIGYDNYDSSLELIFEMDFDTALPLMTKENMEKIVKLAGTDHFWVNLHWYNNGELFKYKDIYVREILCGVATTINEWRDRSLKVSD